MDSFSETLYAEMENRLTVIADSSCDPLSCAEESVKAIIPFVERLKAYFINHTFCSEAEEIHFFKNIKPRFLSALIYYNEIYTIESNRPQRSPRALRKFLAHEQAKTRRFCRENAEFCKYYRTGNNCFDSVYFVRRQPDIRLSIDSTYFLFDQAFSTMHDYTVAKIMANTRIETFLKQELQKLEHSAANTQSLQNPKLKWTGSKAGLVELIYALHTEGVFNNGTSELKEVAFCLETIFGVSLGQYHRVFLEIRARKNERTKFLNSLTEKLVRRMQEADEL